MGILGGLGLTGILSPEVGYTVETMVGDQYPKAGESIKRGNSVYLYWD
jgi:hypothetical protein